MKGIWLALAAVVAGCGITASQGKPVQKCACAAASQQAAEADKRGTESSPLSVKLLNTGESDAEAAQKSASIEHTEQSEKWTIWLTFFLVAATVLQFFALLWQGKQLRRQIKLGNDEFIASHRPRFVIREPYLAVIHCPAEPPEKVAHQVRFILANAGESNGTVVEGFATIMLIPANTWKHLSVEDDAPLNDFGPITLPAGAFRRVVRTLPAEDSEVVAKTLAMHEDNQPLPGRLFLRGFVAYVDGNGTKRRTAFCRPVDPGTKRFITTADRDYDYCD
jgi:hypothetical protein